MTGLKKNIAFRIASLYFIVAALWIITSDKIILFFANDPQIITLMQTLKGWLFVGATTALLFILIHRAVRRKNNLISLLDESSELYDNILSNISSLSVYIIDTSDQVLYVRGNLLHQESKPIQGELLADVDWKNQVFFNIKEKIKQLLQHGWLNEEINIADQWYVVRGRILKNKNDEPFAVMFTFIDVTPQHQQMKELETSKQKFEELFKEHQAINQKLETNISEIEKTNKELTKAKKQAEESDRLKSAFLANMSHEIRTPMNGLLGFSELLATRNPDQDKKTEYMQLIRNCGHQLLRIINDIIDISKIETGQLSLNYTSFSFNSLVDEVAMYANNQIEKSGKNINTYCASRLPEASDNIYCDRERLMQVMLNIVHNAIKFTDQGEIRCEYELLDKEMIEIRIKDSGKGIDDQKQREVFDRFMQGDLDAAKSKGGTGLGLSISKGILDMLGGTLDLESTLGEGSEFLIRIPYKKGRK